MTRLRLLILCALLAAGQTLMAQEPPPPPPDGAGDVSRPPPPRNDQYDRGRDDRGRDDRGARGRNGGQGGSDRPGSNPVDHLIHNLKTEHPEEFQRLMKLREEDPEAFRAAMQELMQGKGGRRGGGQDGDQTTRQGKRFDRGVVGQVLEKLKDENPEKFAELERLRVEDPEAFREQMRGLLSGKAKDFYKHHGGIDLRARENELQELANEYKAADTDAERTRIKTELQAKLDTTFNDMIEAQEMRITQIEEELDDMRDKLERRRSSRDKIVNARLQYLLGEAEPRERRSDRPARRNNEQQP